MHNAVSVNPDHTDDQVSSAAGNLFHLWPHQPPLRVEMDRSSVNAELRPKNSAERSARFGSATCELFGRTSAEL